MAVLKVVKAKGAKRVKRSTSPAAPQSLPAALRGRWREYVDAITKNTRRAPGPGTLDALLLYLRIDHKLQREKDPKPGDLQRHYRLALALGLLSPIGAPTTSSPRSDDAGPAAVPRSRAMRSNASESISIPPRGLKFENNWVYKMQRQIKSESDPARREALELALGRFFAQPMPQAVNDG